MAYELSTMQSEQFPWTGNHEKDKPMLIPAEPESRVRIRRSVVIGIFCCLLLILALAGVTLYFSIKLYTNKDNGLTRTPVSEWQSQTASDGRSSDIGLFESNFTKTDATNLVQMAQKMDEITVILKALNDKVDKIAKQSVDNEQSTSQHREMVEQRLEVITKTVGSVSATIDIVEKKQDRIEEQVKTIQAFRNHTENALETITGTIHTVSATIDTMESKLEAANKQMNVTNGYIADVIFSINGVVLRRFNTVEESVIRNREMTQNNTNTLNEISSRTVEILTQIQLGQNITQKVDSGLKTLSDIEMKLNTLDTRCKESKTSVSELNVTIQRSVLDSLEELRRSMHSNEMLTDVKLDALTEMSNETQEMLQVIGRDINTLTSSTPHKLSIQNMSDLIALTSSNLHTIEKVVREINNKTDEGLELQKVMQGSQEIVHISLGGLREDIESTNAEEMNHTAEILLKLHDSKNEIISAISNFTLEPTMEPVTTTETGLQNVILSKINVIETLAESINASLTIPSSKIPDSSLSTAVATLLAETRVINEAIFSASNQTPSCRSDGCFIKTIPVNLPATSTFVQKNSVRLANAQMSTGSIRGRLEVYRSGSWGTVCDDSFSNTDARVVCRMFGYSTGTQKQSAFFGAGTGTIHMDDVDCSGGESSIFSCSFTSRHNCGHGEDVGVICS